MGSGRFVGLRTVGSGRRVQDGGFRTVGSGRWVEDVGLRTVGSVQDAG